MIMSILGWIVFGLIAGAIARMVYPGPNPMSWAATAVLGVVGSLVGGGLAYMFRLGAEPFQPAGWILSIIGAIAVLAAARAAQRRGTSL
jgi:uncharacterized membrane protein YeaQ/YmgE (transglycosylase-associated protein family)